MSVLPFASFCDRFAGQTGWVVGRGPTTFAYPSLAEEPGPVFFVNDAVGQERWLAEGRPSFFFAHDEAMAGWLLEPGLRSTPVLIVDQPLTGPTSQPRPGLIRGADDPRLDPLREAILYRKHGPLGRDTILRHSRAEIAAAEQLHTASGTIHPLLHFAWYTGCARLRLIGCDGLPEIGYDERLENRSHSRHQNPLTIRVAQERMLADLCVPHDYVGTPPHVLDLLASLQAPADAGAAFGPLRAAADRLFNLLASFGCTALSRRDSLVQSRTCWIRGRWPHITACIACLSSPDYDRLYTESIAPAVGDPTVGFKLVHRTRRTVG